MGVMTGREAVAITLLSLALVVACLWQ